MPMPKFAAQEASEILLRLDKTAREVQLKYASWGMPFEAAKEIVNALDMTADEIEISTYGKESFEKRQAQEVLAAQQQADQQQTQGKTAEVIKRDGDEPYMQAFANPMAPIQVEADEPYMAAYKDDQSSAVHHGKSTTGRPLAP